MSFASAGLCAKAIEAMAASQPLKKLSVIYSVDIIFFFAHLHRARMAIPPSTELIQ